MKLALCSIIALGSGLFIANCASAATKVRAQDDDEPLLTCESSDEDAEKYFEIGVYEGDSDETFELAIDVTEGDDTSSSEATANGAADDENIDLAFEGGSLVAEYDEENEEMYGELVFGDETVEVTCGASEASRR